MKDDIAILVENVSKSYQLAQVYDTHNGVTTMHCALDKVSFQVKKGESLGIVGPNGSGKSTLLKILAGVTKPSSGKVTMYGKVASVLDIGAGFHPELSGMENIYLNGQINGFTKAEIQQKVENIISFSGVEQFIHQPIKSYSNGMYLRLAFSILMHFDFDIYLFDEVLNVGDAAFNLKTQQKFIELKQANKVVVFATHNMAELQSQDNYLMLEKGKVKEYTKKRSLLSNYLETVLEDTKVTIHTKTVEVNNFQSFPASTEIKVLNIGLRQHQTRFFSTNHPFVIEVEYEKLTDIDTLDPVWVISGIGGNILLSSTPFISDEPNQHTKAGTYKQQCIIERHFFGSQVYQLSFCVIKNLNMLSKAGNRTDFDVNKLQENSDLEVVLYWKNILHFKPVFNNEQVSIDLGSLNLEGSLLPGFKWVTYQVET